MRAIPRSCFLSDAELADFMGVVRTRDHRNAARDHAFFVLIANLGLRPSELLRLTRADVKTGARPPWIHVKRTRQKWAPEPVREIALQPVVARVLARWVSTLSSPSDRVFCLTPRQVQRLFHYYANAAGITRPLKLYDLRHTAGNRLWRHTKDARMIQALMGHGRIVASQRYAQVSSADLLRVTQALASPR